MICNVRHTNIFVNGQCAPPSIGDLAALIHNVRMANEQKKHYLREWRQASKWKTLENLAEAIKMSHGQLSKIERGKHPYSQDLLESLAALYGCEPIDLLTGAPNDQPNIRSIWSRADASQRRQIAEIADVVLKRA